MKYYNNLEEFHTKSSFLKIKYNLNVIITFAFKIITILLVFKLISQTKHYILSLQSRII